MFFITGDFFCQLARSITVNYRRFNQLTHKKMLPKDR